MTNPVAQLRTTKDGEKIYPSLAFWCPGCELKYGPGQGFGGLHLLPVNTDIASPSWTWDNNLESPTLSPSILTKSTINDEEFICHSFIVNGVFQFLGDCTHELANKHIPMPSLPDWVVEQHAEET